MKKSLLGLAILAAHSALGAPAPTQVLPSPQQPPQLLPQRSLVCMPADQAAPPVATAPSPTPSQIPTPAPSPTLSANLDSIGTGYWIRVVEQPGAMSAMLLFQTPQTGRGALAGYADVSRVQSQDSSVALELKNTDQSPFQFDLTVSSQRDSNGWREATLVGAELFGGGSLVGVPYQCRVSHD